MRFETFQKYCKYSGFCNIICSHPSRPKMLPPFSPLCMEKKCPVFEVEINTEKKSEVNFDILPDEAPDENGNMIPKDVGEYYSGKDTNAIPVSHNELMEALKVVSDYRSSIIENISYANQVSGENIEQYRQELAKADQTCNVLMKQIENYKLVRKIDTENKYEGVDEDL